MIFAPICREIFTLSFEIMVILDWTSPLSIPCMPYHIYLNTSNRVIQESTCLFLIYWSKTVFHQLKRMILFQFAKVISISTISYNSSHCYEYV